MAAKQNHQVELTPHFEMLLRDKIASGRYASLTEVIFEGLRLLEDRDRNLEKMRDDIEIGWAQAEAGSFVDGPAVFQEIRELSRLRRARSGGKK